MFIRVKIQYLLFVFTQNLLELKVEMRMMANAQIDKGPKNQYIRVNLTLPDELDRVLQELGNDARATGGYKIPKTMIMRALVRLLMTLDVDPSGVRTEDELLKRMMQAIQKL